MNTQQRNSSPESEHEPVTTTSRAISHRIMEITRLTFARQIPTTDPVILRTRHIEMQLLIQEEALLVLEELRLNNRRNNRLALDQRSARSATRRLTRHISRQARQAGPEATPENENN